MALPCRTLSTTVNRVQAPMLVESQVFATAEQLGDAAAEIVVEGLQEARSAGRQFLLGCPGGRSPATTYAALARLVAERRLDLRHLVVVMMDDYLVSNGDGGLVREDPQAAHSCLRFGREQIVGVLSAAAGPGRRPASESLWLPEPDDPPGYDERIRRAGGIDLFLLATGASDGHVGFNPPGSPRDSRTRVVELPISTRSDNLATFPSFGGHLERVPRHGVTVGIATIRELSRRVLMLVSGPDKAQAAVRLRSAGAYDPSWPSTVLAECRCPLLLLDAEAARGAGSATSTQQS